jgi:hypothetical protein
MRRSAGSRDHRSDVRLARRDDSRSWWTPRPSAGRCPSLTAAKGGIPPPTSSPWS